MTQMLENNGDHSSFIITKKKIVYQKQFAKTKINNFFFLNDEINNRNLRTFKNIKSDNCCSSSNIFKWK